MGAITAPGLGEAGVEFEGSEEKAATEINVFSSWVKRLCGSGHPKVILVGLVLASGPHFLTRRMSLYLLLER